MRKPRLWPAVLILVLALAFLAKTWLTGDAIRQMRVIPSIMAGIATWLALLLWLLLFSRLPVRLRLAGLGASALAIAAGAALFRIRGVTGDLVPVLEPRWTGPAALPQAPPTAPTPEPALAAEAAVVASPTPPAAAPASFAPAQPVPSAADAPAATRGHAPIAISTPAPHASYPQFLGPSRNGTLPGPLLARDWSARPPRRLWRQPIGAAWSGFAVADGIAVTQEQRGNEEHVVAYEAATGRVLWSHADSARYATTIAGVGPRATPTIAGERVFTLGATGILNAFERRTGRRIWSRQVVDENGAKLPDWGKSCSPLVIEDRVIVSAGGPDGRSLVAYDAATGSPVWSGGSGGSGYSSPRLVRLGGRPQVLILNGRSVAGHDPASGAVLWEHPFPAEQPNVTTPEPLPGDRVLVSVGYGIGSKLYQVSAAEAGELKASLVWESPRLKSKFANLVVHGGYVYGLDDGVLTCLDPATGERRWKAGRYGHGQLILAGELLLVQSEEGELVLVDPSPDGLRELTRFQALDGKTWNPPALAGSLLLVRNDLEAAAYELPAVE
jgi:outer membrane protein assembly factor BamB